jgi:hypothetical protein
VSDETKKAWGDVGDRFASWGKGVAKRYHEKGTPERTPEEEEREFKRAAKELMDELGRGMEAAADTIRDEQARKEFADALKSMVAAIGTTFNEVSDGIRSGSKSSTEPPPPPPGTPGSDEGSKPEG